MTKMHLKKLDDERYLGNNKQTKMLTKNGELVTSNNEGIKKNTLKTP